MNDSIYSIEFTNSASQISDQLWSECFPPPLEGRWWYETLERSGINDQFTFIYAQVTLDGRPIGIAPAFVMDVPIELVVPPGILPIFRFVGKLFPSILHERTLFLGSPCSDEGNVGLLPGVDKHNALLAVQKAMELKAREFRAPMLVWKDFPDAFTSDMERVAEECGLFHLVSFPGAVVDLPSGTKDGYFAEMKASRRQKLKRKLRKSAECVDVSTQIIQHPSGETLDKIFALFTQTYEKGATKFEKLNRRFFEVVSELPLSHFIVMREKESNEMIAFMLCFDLGDRLINKFIGLDYKRPKEWVLYFRLWDVAVDWALSKGFSSIQSGQTGYAAKIEIGNKLVPLTNYCRHRNSIVHAVYRKVAQSIDWHTLDSDLAAFLSAHPEAKRGSAKPEEPKNHEEPVGQTKSPPKLKRMGSSPEGNDKFTYP